MEVLAIVLVVIGLAWLVVGFMFLSLTWTTLKTHRAAMSALQQHLAQQRVPRAPATAPQQPGDLGWGERR